MGKVNNTGKDGARFMREGWSQIYEGRMEPDLRGVATDIYQFYVCP